jgi:hypothetical protein
MKQLVLVMFVIIELSILNTRAQTNSNNSIIAEPDADRTVFFDLDDEGVAKPIIWGLDLAWLSEANMRRGIAFMGAENVSMVRSSFMPTSPLVDGELQTAELNELKERLRIIDLIGHPVDVMLNDHNPTVHDYFFQNPVNWTKLMEVTAQHHIDHGLNVVAVAPFNEPDNLLAFDVGAGQGYQDDFYDICVEVRKNSFFNDIRITGPNTLNTDVFFDWYNPIKDYVDEGNTHQLAGNFDNYVNIFSTLRANGQMAMNDELHNVMEAMVGVEYGMQSGIWWGTAEYARGEFCKASNGKRLAYNEHRPNWTSASVYRTTDGKIQAFGGGSERQSVTTTYRFVSKDRDVYYDGQGPQREFIMELPGGAPNTYGTSLHCSPEQVINITWGDDIQPVINGRYILVNRNSGHVMEIEGGSTNLGANIQQGTHRGATATHQQWDVKPVDKRIGGDFSYFKIANVKSGTSPDVLNFSLDEGANIIAYSFITANQQWYLEYAEDGWFYIRNRHSSQCLEVANASTASGANIEQGLKNGGHEQQWRFLPVDAAVEFIAPNAPTNLKSTANSGSVELNWSVNSEDDLHSYNVYRAKTSGGPYNTIARNVTTTSFIDNSNPESGEFYYVVKAIDKSLNQSTYSNEVSANSKDQPGLILDYNFENNLFDNTVNLNHSLYFEDTLFTENLDTTSNALVFNGSSTFVKLPHTVLNQEELTIAMWIYWRGGLDYQRIFEFFNDETETMYLATKTDTLATTLVLKKDDKEQRIYAPLLPYKEWTHVAISFSNEKISIYQNGELVTEEYSVSITPSDIQPLFNYLGKGQGEEPYLRADLDVFQLYNYELSPTEVSKLLETGAATSVDKVLENNISIFPNPADDQLNIITMGTYDANITTYQIYNLSGRLVQTGGLQASNKINISGLNTGIYILRMSDTERVVMKRFVKN